MNEIYETLGKADGSRGECEIAGNRGKKSNDQEVRMSHTRSSPTFPRSWPRQLQENAFLAGEKDASKDALHHTMGKGLQEWTSLGRGNGKKKEKGHE